MSTKTGTFVELLPAWIWRSVLREAPDGAGEELLHRALVSLDLVHVPAEQLADQTRNARLASSGLEPGPSSSLFIERDRDVLHELNVSRSS